MKQPFDSVAGSYDRNFTDTPLGRRLRGIVWSRLEARFRSGYHILELNCGTGEDALWMARRGMKVLATDSSPAMLAEAERKIAAAGLSGAVSTRLMDLNDPYLPADTAPFDGVLSNFGGLNCVQHLAPIWNLLRRSVREGGVFVAVPMGRWCAWEIGWNLLQLNPGVAFRRLRREGIPSSVGGSSIRVFYPSLREWRLSAQPAFRLLRVSGLGVFLPPLYLAGPATAMRLIPILDRLESALAGWPPFRGLGDHLILEIVRSGAMASGRVPAASRVASRRGLARTVEPA